MACYWGTGTKHNRIVWIVVGTLLLLGKILIAAGVIGGLANGDCFRVYRQCVDQADARGRPPHGQQDCQDLANAQCKLNTWIRLIIAGIIIWVLGAIVTSYFCCCSQPPPAITLAPSQALPLVDHAVPAGQYPAPSWQQYPYPPYATTPPGYTVVQGVPVVGYPVGAVPPGPPTAGYPQPGPTAYPQAGPSAGPSHASEAYAGVSGKPV